MEITWLGHACFRLRGREATVLFDPYDKEKGYGLGKVTADIVLVSHSHSGHASTSSVGGSPRVLTRPGEYEVKGVPIVGVQTAHDGVGGKHRGGNVAWLTAVEDVTVAHLGDIGHVLTAQQAEALGDVDVLLVPVGGHNTISAAQASEIVTLVQPKIVIPMHYRHDAIHAGSALEGVDPFLREQGISGLEPQAKLTVTKSSLPEDTQVVLLEFRKP